MKKKQVKPKSTSTKSLKKAKAVSAKSTPTATAKQKKTTNATSAPASTSGTARTKSTPQTVASKPEPEIVIVKKAPTPPKPTPEEVAASVVLPPLSAKGLPCDTCSKPLTAADIPVVLEWGSKQPGTPDFIGRPWKRVRCQDCDRQITGRKPKEKSTEQPESPKSKGKVFPKKEHTPKQSAGKLVGKITLLIKDNPRKPGTHGYNSFNLVKNGMSVEEYLSKGGRMNDLRWDIDHGWAKVD